MKAKHVFASGMLVVVAHWSAAQGIPVLDASNLAQAGHQVLAWVQQTDLATRNLTSMTGTRSLGEITNAIPTSVLDPNLRNTVASIASHADLNAYGSGQLASLQQATLTRYSQIQSLLRSINQTNDPKSIAELQGRIQSEQAMIANEQKEAELLRMSLDQQHRAIDAARVQFNARASMQPLQAN